MRDSLPIDELLSDYDLNDQFYIIPKEKSGDFFRDLIDELAESPVSSAITKKPRKRQSPFKRNSEAPPLSSPGELKYAPKILRFLAEMGPLTTSQITRLMGDDASSRVVLRNLRRLFDTRHTERRSQRALLKRRKTLVEVVHLLDRRGARYLRPELKMEPVYRRWEPRDNRKLGNLDHRLAINDIWITARLEAEKHGYNLGWMTERELLYRGRKEESKVRVYNDGFMVLDKLPRGKPGRSFRLAIEADMGEMGAYKWQRKAKSILKWIKTGGHKTLFESQANNPRILVVASSNREVKEWQKRHDRLMSEERQEEYRHRRLEDLRRWTEKVGGKEYFLFTTAGQLRQNDFYHDPVYREVGGKKLSLLQVVAKTSKKRKRKDRAKEQRKSASTPVLPSKNPDELR